MRASLVTSPDRWKETGKPIKKCGVGCGCQSSSVHKPQAQGELRTMGTLVQGKIDTLNLADELVHGDQNGNDLLWELSRSCC